MVPWTTEPFLSSMVTVSLLSFIKNLRGSEQTQWQASERGIAPDELHDGAGDEQGRPCSEVAADGDGGAE